MNISLLLLCRERSLRGLAILQEISIQQIAIKIFDILLWLVRLTSNLSIMEKNCVGACWCYPWLIHWTWQSVASISLLLTWRPSKYRPNIFYYNTILTFSIEYVRHVQWKDMLGIGLIWWCINSSKCWNAKFVKLNCETSMCMKLLIWIVWVFCVCVGKMWFVWVFCVCVDKMWFGLSWGVYIWCECVRGL